MTKKIAVLARRVESRILVLRGRKVILDAELAELYGVEVRHLNQQVKRNAKRFPPDFLFRLSASDYRNLRSQFVISSDMHGGRRYLPHAFTEHGAIMAATVLNSERAIEMSIYIVRAFARMREISVANQQIVAKLAEFERRFEGHDADIQDLMETIRQMMAPPPRKGPRIGFQLPSGSAKGQRKPALIVTR